MVWDIEITDEFTTWYRNLDEDQRAAVAARVDLLEQVGPTLGRPTVAEVLGSSVPHLKELRVSKGGALRVLFVFDPRSVAVLLLGGDKSGDWKAWYATAIPEAERLYTELLDELRTEGLIE